MSKMKEVYTRMQEICEVCGSHTKCDGCVMTLTIDDKLVRIENKQIVSVSDQENYPPQNSGE